MPVIAVDATPLTPYSGAFGGHAIRGIGRYLTSVLTSLAGEQPDWAAAHVLPVRTADVPLAFWRGDTVVTRRVRLRPQDAGWLSGPVLDRIALGRRPVDAWVATDPTAPLAPPRTGFSIVVCYDLIPLLYPNAMATMRRHRRAVYQLYLQRLRHSDLVIAISDSVADDLGRWLHLGRDRIAVVYPGLVAAPPDGTADSSDAPDLLFVGVPAAHKNPGAAVDTLAELVRRGHDVRLRFVGTHPAPARQDLVERAAGAGVGDRVDYLDQADDERLTALYRSSVLLAPSTVEGLGLAPIEALLAGGRAVCGSAPVFRETLGDAVEYADPAEAGAAANAYEKLATTPLDVAHHEAVAARFAPSASAAATMDALGRFIG
ncbi:MAG TPA: glycosyltransferase [Candidatus Limnocylindrales bacterium]|nr:glycosyltransferase [Candidatus Limnocylindrales bacterium]